MKHSDSILMKASKDNRGLTMAERGELREAYLWEQQQSEKEASKLQRAFDSFSDNKDPLNMPRHRALENCIPFEECPICFKNRNKDTSLLRIYNFMKRYPEDFCMKPEIHNPKTYEMMIKRGRIDLDASNY